MHNIWEFLLQTTSVVLVAALLLLIKRLFEDKLSPRWQYGIWGLFALRMLLPTLPGRQILFPVPLVLETVKARAEQHLSSAYTEIYVPLASDHVFPFFTKVPMSITDWLFVLYAAGVLFFLLHYLIAYIRLRLLLRRGTPAPAALQHRMDTISEKYQLPQCHTVAVDGLSSAFVCGVFRPILALPTNQEIDDKVLLHELLHLKYRDALQNILWCVFRALHWCNPLLVPVFHRIQNDMESLCDQRVLERLDGEERREYGQILLSMVNETYAYAPGTTSISNGGKNISRRIAAIVRFKKYPKGMALVSLCIILLLGAPAIIGIAGTYDISDYQPQTESALTRAMAMARIRRCTTMAGALDTYAKGLLLHNGIYLATASPLSSHADLEAAMRDRLGSEKVAWYLPPKDETGHSVIQSGYQIFNLTQTSEHSYEALLVLPVWPLQEETNDHSASTDDTPADSSTYRYDNRYIMIPVTLRKEDAWVVEETGERVYSDKYYSDTCYDNSSSDIPGLKEVHITGETGTLTASIKQAYYIDNTINTNSYGFFHSSTFNQQPQPDAVFAEIKQITSVFYTCQNNNTGHYPAQQLGLHLTRLNTENTPSKNGFSESETMSTAGDASGSSSNGTSWRSKTIQTDTDYTISDLSVDTVYEPRSFPSKLPYGHLVQIIWDSEVTEKFTILWEDTE